MAKWLFIALSCCRVLFGTEASFSKVHYAFASEPIDVVIPCAPKDAKTLSLCIDGIRQYGKNIRRVIVVSSKKLTEKAEWINESVYPFSKKSLAKEIFYGDRKAAKKFLNRRHSRIGWIFQQFLKLYAPLVIPGISSNVLILDADVIFVNPVEFINEQGGPLLNTAVEYHPPYFWHMAKVLPGLHRVHQEHSGVAHHMLFQRPVLEDFFALIEKQHKLPAWKALCRCIDPKNAGDSALSEYEMYFNFILLRTNQATLRTLPFLDVSPLKNIGKYQGRGYVYVTSHNYSR